MIAWGELPSGDVGRLRALLDAAFDGDFTDDDWAHCAGGVHVVVRQGGVPVAYAAVVARTLTVGDVPLDTGYVEAVAVLPRLQGRGLGTAVMRRVGEIIVARHAWGALSTDAHGFYSRCGWERWRGPTHVRGRDGTVRRSADEDGGIMVLRTARTAAIAVDAPLTCDDRPGDAW